MGMENGEGEFGSDVTAWGLDGECEDVDSIDR